MAALLNIAYHMEYGRTLSLITDADMNDTIRPNIIHIIPNLFIQKFTQFPHSIFVARL